MQANLAQQRLGRFSASQWAGILLLLMIVTAVSRLFVHEIPVSLAGGLAWLSMLLLLPRLRRLQAIQAVVLMVVGLFCTVWAGYRGVALDIPHFLSSNTNLLVLLAGVSYLRLITLPANNQQEALPRGRNAFLRTLLGTHLFSAVINLSALLIVADRLADKQQLKRQAALPLARAFTAAAFWSPFFAAMGVALTYAPGASLVTLALQGLPLALFALAYTYWEAYRNPTESLDDFRGYPLHFSALWVPSLLVAGVLLVHHLRPDLSVILIIAGLSLVMTVLVSLLRRSEQEGRSLKQHTLVELPKMSGELTLFLSAGVLSVGLNSLFQSFDGLLPFTELTFTLAVGLLCLMVALAIIGIHPVISIATLGTWLAPLHADPNILGMIFLCAWAIGVVASPLSGMNLALLSRYSLTARQILGWHYRYALMMLLVSSAALWLLMAR